MTPMKMRKLIEGMAREIEELLEELRRHSLVIDIDLTDYETYRDECPREDA